MTADQPPSPGPETPDGEDAPMQLRTEFWATVFLLNLTILGLVLGPVLLATTQQRRIGTGLVVIGAVSAVLAVRRYRMVSGRLEDDEYEE